MDEIRQIWKRKGFVLIIIILSFFIAGTVNFMKKEKYLVHVYFSLDKYDKEILLDRERFKAFFFEGIKQKSRYKIEEHRYVKKNNMVYASIKTTDPDRIFNRAVEIGGIIESKSVRLIKKITFLDKIFYTVLFSLSVLVMASVFVLVFFKEEQEEERLNDQGV